MGIRIDGKALAEKMQEDMKQEVKELKTKGITPGLVVLLVGENPASQTYVKNKEIDESAQTRRNNQRGRNWPYGKFKQYEPLLLVYFRTGQVTG